MNILAAFLAAAPGFGDRTAIIDREGRKISFAAFARASAAVAGAWRQAGLERGERVLVAMPLGIDLYVGLAALWRLGAVAVFPEPALGLKGLRHAARATKADAFLTGGWFRLLRFAAPELYRIPRTLRVSHDGVGSDAVADCASDDPALISFTSGSTGAPKAIVRSHGFLAAQNARVAELLASERGDEVDLVAFPVFVIANLALGVTSALPGWNLRRPHEADVAGIIRQVRECKATRALLPPSICEALAEAGQALPLRTIYTGGGPVFPDLIERILEASPHLDLVSVYGSTEAEPIAHLHARDIAAADWEAMKAGKGLLAGAPIPQIRLRLEDGEIVVNGAHVNKGYLDPSQDRSTKLLLDGEVWHRTGDAASLDAQGRLWLLGRQGGSVGGIHPFCAEATARFWDGVRRAALVEMNGEAILAIEGDAVALPAWKHNAAAIGPLVVRHVDRIPLDARHRSKVDAAALKRALSKS